MFIPNEQVYGFVQENDRSILDDALRNKIVVCSPLTLYAVLAVVRQAVDNFQLERTSSEILGLLGEFSRQWEKYSAQLEKVQQRFEQVAKEYSGLMTTRHRALQRPLDKIEHLRHEERGLLDAEIPPLDASRLSAGVGSVATVVAAVTHVTVLGGGQLGRMLGLAGVSRSGCTFRSSIRRPRRRRRAVGDARRRRPRRRRRRVDEAAAGADVVTYEWEGVPADTARGARRGRARASVARTRSRSRRTASSRSSSSARSASRPRRSARSTTAPRSTPRSPSSGFPRC